MDISTWIAYWAGWTPEKTALRFEGRSIGYRQLEEAIARTAATLRDRGVTPGDRVAYLGSNCPELLEVFFACARIGAIFVPLNARMPPAELRVFLGLSGPRLLVAEEHLAETAAACAAHLSSEAIELFFVGRGDLVARATRSPIPANPEADPAAPILIVFTSGTTGTPKGAVHTNAGVASNALDAIAGLGITAADEILMALPMFHIAGTGVLTLPALRSGATVTVHRHFDPSAALHDIQRYKITLFMATPPMTKSMTAVEEWAAADLASLRAQLVGGTIVTEEAIDPWRERGVPVVQGYGMTEAGPAATLVPLHDVPRKSLTAGKPTLHTRLRIIDRFGHDVPAGRSGEVVIRGPSVTTGYWQNPEATREAIPDGWLRTGDLGFLDDEGYLHLIGRIKDIIIVGVSNVYPADLEAVLASSPSVADAAAIGVTDDELGEVPVAFVVRAPGASLDEEEALGLFAGRLAAYKHPRRVFFLEAMPRTGIGKVEKRALRALAQDLLFCEKSAQGQGFHSRGTCSSGDRGLSPAMPLRLR
ncbi:MAG TPA: AMP-binding protein [Actinomycetota bacterium]|nr:AMP-binding protein [Actinomycetota bacterium]